MKKESFSNYVNLRGSDCKSTLNKYLPISITIVLLAMAMLLDYTIKPVFFTGYARLAWYLAAFLPVAIPVIKNGIDAIAQRDIFNEFTLMSVATIGAFYIREYGFGCSH